ncbi:MAG: 2-dehydropantoate 2-reductase [Proteobacteria bacterium]|nr:2-dehydropantoate 2-reductase [Pseudomonadota bacterium]MDA1354833.1 2-dehydropantoate 2-reductase [Pseudomonadota bacterium]
MRIYVIGAGAMGSLYGGLLARSGCEVIFVDRWREHMDAVAADGLRLSGITGDFTVPVRAIYASEEAGMLADGGDGDIAIILTDANSTAFAASLAKRLLKPGGYALTLQNGIGNIEALEAELGRPRVIGGLSYHSAAMVEPGHAIHTHKGPTWIGELDGTPSARVSALATMLSDAGFKPQIVADILGQIWTKFIHNCAINPVSALTGLRVGEISRVAEADALQSAIIEEALAVVAAKGIALVDSDPMASIKKFCLAKFNKPSMLQHMEQGRRTEIDALNGALVREGRALGIATPYNEAVTWMVAAMQHQNMQVMHGAPIDYEALEAEIKGGAAADRSEDEET